MFRIIPLGGVGKVTGNLFIYEYEHNGNYERLIIDCGIGFPEQEMLGADLLVPDISYLKGKEDSIVGIVLSHGHDDHIAALPYLLPTLGQDIPVFASKLTAGFVEHNLKEFGIEKHIQVVDSEPFVLGSFTIDPIKITHSVPDARHFVIKIEDLTIYHGSDFKFDWTPMDNVRPDLQKIAFYGRQGIDLLLTDCLRVENEDYSLSEKAVGEDMAKEMRDISGKILITMMSSNIHRIQQAVDVAVTIGRQIAFIGRSMEDNVKIASMLGFLHLPDKMVINKKRVKDFPDKHLCLIVAGSQGQEGSTLTRIANGQHQLIKIGKGDHVIFSADPIPGNENAVYKTVDEIAKTGATVSYREIQDTLHVSGHASAQDLRLFLTLTKPKFVLPIGGTFRHMNQFRVLAKNMGFTDQEVLVPESGDILALNKNNFYIDNKIKLKTVIVDGLGIGDVGPLVLSDRQKMSQSGMVVIAIPVDKASNQVKGKIEVITRGFVFVKGSQELIAEMQDYCAQIMPEGMIILDWQKEKETIEDKLNDFILEKTGRQPLVLGFLVKS
ncbi:ribonuclease J [Candidatus Beckwithbacteria bacterium]|nr:ribonuclease J [Candidatus Beckwithbacteria bacterium]